jgi:hypothetical protein
MNCSYRTIVRHPNICTEDELESFVELVELGGEVAEGLQARVRNAIGLSMLYDGTKLVGTAGIKRPYAEYHRKVFAKAKTNLLTKDYPFELGWVYISTSHRGRHLTGCLLDSLLKLVKGVGIFATTRTSNTAIQHVLTSRNFRQIGTPYKSQETAKAQIMLFISS